jgi:flagellar protein FliS
MSQNASFEYLKNSVLTAPPEQLQLMLYDGAIRFVTAGRDALVATDYEGAFNGFDRAQRIVLQLHGGLRREVHAELVDQIASLYNFVYRRLVDANSERDPAAADDALQILRHMRETWTLLLDKLAQERGAATPRAINRSNSATPTESLSLEG